MNKTELVFILDMSGSMAHLTDDTIGGFNSVLKEQAAKDGEALVTTYLFNNDSRMLHDRLPIDQVRPMTNADYQAGGCTALVDALGEAIHHIVGIHRYARKEDVPEHTIFIITTDGMENASHRYSAEQVKQMIRHEQEKYGWEFIFLAANIDAVETAKSYGIDADHAVDYLPDAGGTDQVYAAMSMAIGNVRRGARLKEDRAWRKSADMDYHKRKK
ncbi:MAG: VWA domain-containing protein [Oscillospiraceae bacterium]|nr:VWA domain-containing protein [Oscillospiraceae bacterium]